VAPASVIYNTAGLALSWFNSSWNGSAMTTGHIVVLCFVGGRLSFLRSVSAFNVCAATHHRVADRGWVIDASVGNRQPMGASLL